MWARLYLFSMCILEEMQWKRTKSVSSAEFFHGTLELLEKEVPLFLVKGEGDAGRWTGASTVREKITDHRGGYRPARLSAEQHLMTRSAGVMAPCVVSTLLVDRLAAYFEHHTGHDLNIRRYRQFDY